ncbi:hypothetical protein NB725_004616 [Pantoea ananatis]|nr:hypothetical protein [Pantoea ananatis]MCW0341898.1 hypothetical protein [Pantoea ananatis]MCW0360377.1 hypothetical protein [Pantoea ananatis]MCW0365006.1 hypothetical protein [Pantoea ananatis]
MCRRLSESLTVIFPASTLSRSQSRKTLPPQGSLSTAGFPSPVCSCFVDSAVCTAEKTGASPLAIRSSTESKSTPCLISESSFSFSLSEPYSVASRPLRADCSAELSTGNSGSSVPKAVSSPAACVEVYAAASLSIGSEIFAEMMLLDKRTGALCAKFGGISACCFCSAGFTEVAPVISERPPVSRPAPSRACMMML